jgi:hypothetical protein
MSGDSLPADARRICAAHSKRKYASGLVAQFFGGGVTIIRHGPMSYEVTIVSSLFAPTFSNVLAEVVHGRSGSQSPSCSSIATDYSSLNFCDADGAGEFVQTLGERIEQQKKTRHAADLCGCCTQQKCGGE